MTQLDLLNNFINALHSKIRKKSELVNFISESLNIEKDSAYRRLSKKVYFSITEMGVLASKLGISIDSLFDHKFGGYRSTPAYTLHCPKSQNSMNHLLNWMESDLRILQDITNESTDAGVIFNSLPIEFVMSYDNLLKFMYFKWGYYFVNSSEFKNFSLWKMPAKLELASGEIRNVYKNLETMTYIWDVVSLSCLAKDIVYFYHLQSLTADDVESIKRDLNRMLDDIEKVADGISTDLFDSSKIQIYVSTVHLGTYFSYYISDKKWYSSFHSFFIGSNFSDDYDNCIQVREWMNSMKKVCTLISHSGAKERRLFFDEQHRIVNSINSSLIS